MKNTPGSSRRLSGVLALLFLTLGQALAANVSPFPRPAGLEPDITFWKRVFTEVDTHHGLIHDDRQLDIVYEVIPVPDPYYRKARKQRVRQAKEKYRAILLSLAKGKTTGLGADAQRVHDMWSAKGATAKTYRQAAGRLRFQLGQSDKFRDGWIRAGQWRKHIQHSLEQHGVPGGLAALPHVESSFNPEAYSHIGAAGLWQFTRSTGRRYMRVDHVVDERMDPFIASEAAAQLLRYNYDLLGSWPLAITAYNHGAAGLRQAVRRLGTSDIEPILRYYKGRTFGFASRNFYVAFLAALEADREAEEHFGPLQAHAPDRSITIQVPDYVTVSALERALGMDRETLKKRNPALRPLVWREEKFVPRGYPLRVDCDTDCERLAGKVRAIPAGQRYIAQKPDLFHQVRRGQTLSGIATDYGVSMRSLMEMNNLRSRNRIRAGQKLRLPQPGGAVVRVALARPETASTVEPENGTYRVRSGDSLSRIATRLGVSEETLMSVNGITNRNRIYSGQVLRVAMAQREDVTTDAAPALAEQAPGPETTPVAPGEAVTADAGTPVATETTDIAMVETGTAGEVEEDIGKTLAEEAQQEVQPPGLLADPSDYTVASDGTIEVQAVETLGHYADWLQIRTQRLRDINRIPFGNPLSIGRRLKLDFSRISPEEFVQIRQQYHRDLQAEFFAKYRITDTREHTIRRGESLWTLTVQMFKVPIWLFRQYNPDVALTSVRPGTKLHFPVIERRSVEPGNAKAASA